MAATRGWGGSIALAVGVAAGTAAAQLGIGYGLGIIAWPSGTDTAGDSAWLASLTWTSWIAGTSTVLGAIVADRFSGGEIGEAPAPRRPQRDTAPASPRRPNAMATGAWRLVIALTAAVGGLLTVPLVAVPARAAHRPENLAPQVIAGGYAIVGVVIGLIIAIGALSSRAVATNVVATTAWLWLLAVAAVINGVTGQGVSTARLGVWRFDETHFLRQTFSLPGAALMMGVALVIGVGAAWPAGRRGDNRVGMAISGAVGPLLVAAAYFLAPPRLVGAQADEQLSAYLIAPYAVITGLAGSVLLAAAVMQREQRLAEPRPDPATDLLDGTMPTADPLDLPIAGSGGRDRDDFTSGETRDRAVKDAPGSGRGGRGRSAADRPGSTGSSSAGTSSPAGTPSSSGTSSPGTPSARGGGTTGTASSTATLTGGTSAASLWPPQADTASQVARSKPAKGRGRR